MHLICYTLSHNQHKLYLPLYAAVTLTTYRSSSKPEPPPQGAWQAPSAAATQPPTQSLGGQGVVLLQGRESRVVPFVLRQLPPYMAGLETRNTCVTCGQITETVAQLLEWV